MLNELFKKITAFSRLVSIVLISLTLLLAKSIYLIIFITILLIIDILLTNIDIKYYFRFLKNILIWLAFILLIYILMLGMSFKAVVFIYKLILILLFIQSFLLKTNFDKLNYAIYKILRSLEFLKVNVNSLSYNIALYIELVKIIDKNGNEIKKSLQFYGLKSSGVKHFIIPVIMKSLNDVNDFENNIKLKMYERKVENQNWCSDIIMIIFAMIFMIAIFKEVIL